MNIKKLFLSAMVLAVILETAACFAQISKSDLNIGGIYYGQPLSELVRMLGQPEWRKPNFIKFKYGSSNIFITPSDTQDTVIQAIFSNGRHDLKTKAGIGYGSTLADIKAAYGEPDYVSSVGVTYVTDLSDGNQYRLSLFLSDKDTIYSMAFRKNRPDEYIERVRIKHWWYRPRSEYRLCGTDL